MDTVPTLIVALFLRVGSVLYFQNQKRRRGHGNICHRQAMDVESRASGRAGKLMNCTFRSGRRSSLTMTSEDRDP